MIRYFRKKPVVVSAVVWDGSIQTADFLCNWSEGTCFVYEGELMVATLEGNHHALVGDYIIQGVAGEFYPCKPGILQATYDEVEAPLSQPEEAVRNHDEVYRMETG